MHHVHIPIPRQTECDLCRHSVVAQAVGQMARWLAALLTCQFVKQAAHVGHEVKHLETGPILMELLQRSRG